MSRLAFDSFAALLAGQRGNPTYRYRLHKSSIEGEVGEAVGSVDGGEVTLDNVGREWTWEISFSRRELVGTRLADAGEYVRLFVEVRDPLTLEWHSLPFGMYRLDAPNATHDAAGSAYPATGRSPEVLLLNDYAVTATSGGYLAPAGSGVLSRVRAILESRGVPAGRINFPSADKKLLTPMWFDPFQDYEACSYLRIANALLNAGGFYALYTDAVGDYRTKEIEEAGTGKADVLYSSEGPHRMVVGTIEEQYDLERFANKVVVFSGDPNETVPVVGVAVNRDPDSPGSADKIGFFPAEPLEMQNIISQKDADRLARAELKRRTAVDHRLTLSVMPDPRRGPREDIELDVRRPNRPDPDGFGRSTGEPGKRVASGRWTVAGFSLPLSDPPGLMSFELTRAERLTAGSA